LKYTLLTSPAHGTLSGTAPDLTYTPASNFYGSDTFTYQVNDGAVDSNVATVSITINSVNDAPVADNKTISTAEDTFTTVILSSSDVEGSALTFSVATGPAHGILSGTPPNMTYTPFANYFGADSFTYTANDGEKTSEKATVSVTITPQNDAPTADNKSITTAEDTPAAILLSGSDVEGSALSYEILSGPAHGSLSGTGAERTYTPIQDYNGTDTLTYRVSDGSLNSAEATVSITLTAVDDPTEAMAQSVTANEDEEKAITLTVKDVDGDHLSYHVTDPSHGTLSGTAPNLTYTPTLNYTGDDSFSFYVNDGTGDSNTAVVSITVNPVNDAPTAEDQSSLQTEEDQALNITLTGSDLEGDKLTYSIVQGPAHGALAASGANVIYTPAENYNGDDSFTFKVNDGLADSNVATVSLTVSAVNDAPAAVDQSVSTLKNIAKSIFIEIKDVDGDKLTYTIIASPAHGSLSGTAPNLIYTPATGYLGDDSFTFKGNDGALDSNVGTVSITVTQVNHAPTDMALSKNIVDDTSPAGTVVGTLSANDPDAGDSVTFSLVSGTGSGDNAAFEITGSTLKTTVVVDIKTKPSYSIRVKATDAGGLSYEKVFTIEIGQIGPTGGAHILLPLVLK
jgi:hypothetical protein